MSHLVESMMFTRGKLPWHGLGKPVHENILTGEAIKESGLDWGVSAVPLYTGMEHGQQKVPNRAIIRDTDKRVLGVVGSEYVPLQNSEAFRFFDPYIQSNEANLDTAGSLKQGQNIWVLAKLNRDPIEITKDDVVEKYLLLSNSHKGGSSVKVGFTPIRVVCANTLAMSERHEDTQLIRVTHSNRTVHTLEKVREVINAANASFEATAEQYKYLASKELNMGDLEKFVRIVFIPKGITSERAAAREEKMIETIQRIFETGMGNNEKRNRGTYWSLYNAATEYLTHESNKDSEKRLNANWFGKGVKKNKQALFTAVKMAGGLS